MMFARCRQQIMVSLGSRCSARSSPPSSFLSSTMMMNRSHQHQQRLPMSLRAYPQYSIFGEDCMLAVKFLAPSFRVVGANTLVVDSNKRGRILLEWMPRRSEGGLNREQNMRFGLSAEEAGLILELLPENPVHLIRRPPAQNNSGDAVSYDTGEVPDKVMRITPGEGGTCSFLIDYEKDGVGGQSLTGSDGNQTTGPLEVVAQLGEMQVIREVMRSTIPHLVGWSTMLDANVRHNIDNAVRMRQDQGGHQNYPHSNRNAGGYSNSGSGGGGPPVPF